MTATARRVPSYCGGAGEGALSPGPRPGPGQTPPGLQLQGPGDETRLPRAKDQHGGGVKTGEWRGRHYCTLSSPDNVE